MQSIAPAPGPQGVQRDQEMSADNDLRAQLAAVINTSQHHGPGGLHGYSDMPASSSASPHEHIIDPSIGGGQGAGMSSGNAGDSGGDDSMGDGRKGGKRELSQSKRAAQNRAAQRAFRQRKEGYIKKLEEQVRELHSLEDNYKSIQAENYSLREYIIHLQSRLIESQGEYPQPPPNVNLNHPHHSASAAAAAAARHEHAAAADHHHQQQQQRHDPSSGAPMAPMSQLQASAARTIAAAGLQSAKHGVGGGVGSGSTADEHAYSDHSKRYKSSAGAAASAAEDSAAAAAADEEIIRSQLQPSHDGLPTAMSV